MLPKRPPRLPAFDYVGLHAYFLTICTAHRQTAFANGDAAHAARDQLLRTADGYGFEATAYCFMPDHLHVLASGIREDADFRKFVAMFKQRSGFQYRQSCGSRLWQTAYYEHVLRAEDDVPAVVAYILGNPLRAGLVSRVEEYHFMGSQKYAVDDLVDFVQVEKLPWE